MLPETFLRGFDRPNIHLAFSPKERPRAQILAFAEARRGQSGIVYCGTRAKTESLAAGLTCADSDCVAQLRHKNLAVANLPRLRGCNSKREGVQECWLRGPGGTGTSEALVLLVM